ncbi:MAG: arylsulfatase [Planctomycetota bacterium]
MSPYFTGLDEIDKPGSAESRRRLPVQMRRAGASSPENCWKITYQDKSALRMKQSERIDLQAASWLALWVLLGCGIAGWRQPAAAGHPNIVLVLVDDMGYGDAACFNPESKIPTPHLNALARQGIRFTDAHAPGPLCHMSRYGLMTGRYPFRTNVNRWPEHALIQPDQVTLASFLKESGYTTAMIGKWHLGFEESGYTNPLPGGPVDVGFDHYFGIRASTDIPPYFYIRGDRAVNPPSERIAANTTAGWSPIQGKFWRAGGIAPDLELPDVLPRFTEEALAVIDEHARSQNESPLFLYVAFPAPHTPWLPSKDFQGTSDADLFGDFMVMVDDMTGQIIASLDENNLSSNTLFLFTSDNGPVWYETDVERFDHDSSGGWRGMKADAWEAGHRMPMIVRWPGHTASGTESDQLVCFTDILATLADAIGRPLPEDAGPDSISFLPAMTGQSVGPNDMRQQWAMRSGGGMMVVRDGDWKWINGIGSGGFSKPRRVEKLRANAPSTQLYNLAEDPAEMINVANLYPERVARMRSILEATLKEGLDPSSPLSKRP